MTLPFTQAMKLLLLCTATFGNLLSTTAAEQSGLRTTASTVQDTWERLPVVHRLYGEHNGEVRKNIRKLEEQMPRYQTGLAPDPTHEVPYENHPYDKKHRHLQNGANTTTASRFGSIRMHFETFALEQMSQRQPSNAAKISCKCVLNRFPSFCR